MINISIICVGKIKEKYFTAAVDEYKKRLSRFCNLNIIELKDEPIPQNPTAGEMDIVLYKEGEKIKKSIPKGAYIIPLCVEGKEKTSEKLAFMLNDLAAGGTSHIAFIIGGSLGIADDIKQMSKLKLSFSKMTFPHQLMRVILTEQLYRAFTINNNISYHK